MQVLNSEDIFKGGNMTVTLMNYSAVDKSINAGED